MKPETAQQLKERALAAYLRTDVGAPAPDAAELVKFDAYRFGGQYVILRTGHEVAAVYKVTLRPGPDRYDPRQGAFVVDSMSVGLKRLKRVPKEVLAPTHPQEKEPTK